MTKSAFIATIGFLTAALLSAQTLVSPPRSVRANGTASIFVNPDQAQIDATVTTQGMTAQIASSQNATQSAAVLSALTQLLGAGANIKTINYSVTPNYNYPPNGAIPVLIGFTASNTVEVVLTGVTTVGTVIDTAIQAGATSVTGIRFSLKDTEPSRRQALQQAALVAKSHADAMAGALGGTVGTVLVLQEGSSVQPVTGTLTFSAGSTTTPIQSGLIEVSATVALEALLN
jgi:uncharacterized protein YggE